MAGKDERMERLWVERGVREKFAVHGMLRRAVEEAIRAIGAAV